MAEDVRYRTKVKAEKEKRVHDEEFQKNQGNYAQQKRVANYIRKVTIGHVDVLDPTGTALRIDPSKVTVLRTHAFGLGRAAPEEIQKVERQLSNQKQKMATWK